MVVCAFYLSMLRRQKQEDFYALEASLIYVVPFKPIRAT